MDRRESIAKPVLPGFVLRPSVALAAPWIYACDLWFVFILVTMRFAREPATERFVGSLPGAALVGISIVNALFLVALVADGRAAWKLPRCVRLGPLLGVAFCVVNIVLLQYGALLAHDPFRFQ